MKNHIYIYISHEHLLLIKINKVMFDLSSIMKIIKKHYEIIGSAEQHHKTNLDCHCMTNARNI